MSQQVGNITIDGQPGVGVYPGWNAAQYESVVRDLLRAIFRTRTGAAVQAEITRAMVIIPWPNPTTEQNADASARELQHATPRGQTALYCGDIPSTPSIETGTPIPGAGGRPIVGTGRGSDTLVRFTPSMWGAGSSVTGPGSGRDEILLHEMIHAIRSIRGISRCASLGGHYDTEEEFFAIVVTNMYSAELGRPLRAHHAGFTPLANPDAFYRQNTVLMRRLCQQQPSLTRALARVQTAFNPFSEYY